MEDSLHIEYTKILEYCDSRKIPVFLGDFDSRKLIIVDWKDERENDWLNYLTSLPLISEIPVIVSIQKYYEADYFEIDEIEKQTVDLQTRLNSIIKRLKENVGHISMLELSFIKNDLCFRYVKYANWMDSLVELDELCDTMIEFDENGDDEKSIFSFSKKTLNRQEIQEYVNRLLNEEDFLFLSSPNLRKSFIESFFEKELDYASISVIAMRAEFELDKYLRKKVQELKSEGKNGVQIMSILKLSRDRLRKYI